MKKCVCCKQMLDYDRFFLDIKGNPMPKCKSCIINGAPDADESRVFHIKHADALYQRNLGKKYKDIAEDMNVPINTVKTWIRRARLNLLGVVPR